MANLVIVESPYKIGTIKGFLGSGYKVVASVGHVRDLPKSTLGVDIDNDFAAHYINIRGKGQIIKDLKKEVKASSKVFLATDPDREGEAISWHLAVALGLPIDALNRVTFNELSKTVVKNAIKNPRKIDMNLVNSQQARRILDRIVGYKLSPFLWKNVKSGLSAGRVQSVATRIIVEREQEIEAFEPVEYWTIDALLETKDRKALHAKFFGNADGRIELRKEEDAMRVVNAIEGQPFTVGSIKRALKLKNPAPPFTTSTMQQEASRKLSFQSQRCMKVAQELYEGINIGSENGGVHGLITYMRTDSLRISGEAAQAAEDFIRTRYGEEYYPKTRRIYKTKAEAQDAHEAIRPVDVNVTPEAVKKYLSSDQFKLYRLIWNRFIASQMASAELDTVTADIECAGYIFRSSGYTIKFQGYMAVYEESEDVKPMSPDAEPEPEKTKLPQINEGERLGLNQLSPLQHFTEPPPRFTEATLVKFLEEKGIGRPSTYATIITTIISRGYVNREGKSLRPTQLGFITTKIMIESFPDVVDYTFTAKMEDELDDIENGTREMNDVLGQFYVGFARDLEKAEATVSKEAIEVPIEETDILCDKCGSRMIIKNGRYGKFAACPNYPECKNTKPLDRDGKPAEVQAPVMTDMKCELCGSPMLLRTGRFGSFYACSKYPECKGTKRIAKTIGVKCPKCGSELVAKYGKNRTAFYSCEKYPTCDFSTWDLPLAESCPDCGKPLYKKKGKPLIVCADKACGYKRADDRPEPTVDNMTEDGGDE